MNTYKPAVVLLSKKEYVEITLILKELGFNVNGLGLWGEGVKKFITNNAYGKDKTVDHFHDPDSSLTRIMVNTKEEFLALCSYDTPQPPSLEEQEGVLIAKRDVINKKLKQVREAIKANKPKIGDIGLFWNDLSKRKYIGCIINIINTHYVDESKNHWKHFEKLPEHLAKEIQELLMIKS